MWYSAKLFFQCCVEGVKKKIFTCDEIIIVLRSSSPENAYKKALKIGQKQEESYKNCYGQNVYWKFLGIQELYELLDKQIKDGTEIISRLVTKREPAKNTKKIIPPKEKLQAFISQGLRNKR